MADVSKLLARLEALKKKYGESKTAVVGFQTNYAIVVHEDLEMNHPNGGQAKYLEQPAREMKPTFGKMVKELLAKGVPLPKVLMTVGLRLQREAQLLVPVDTALLKNSAFTKLEE